jgi:hypothetical protein
VPQGGPGPQGPQGDPGPATAPAYRISGTIAVPIGTTGRETRTLATFDLPAGRYALSAPLRLTNRDFDNLSFYLYKDEEPTVIGKVLSVSGYPFS